MFSLVSHTYCKTLVIPAPVVGILCKYLLLFFIFFEKPTKLCVYVTMNMLKKLTYIFFFECYQLSFVSSI